MINIGIFFTIFLILLLKYLPNLLNDKLQKKLSFIPNTTEENLIETISKNNKTLGIYIPHLKKGFLIELNKFTRLNLTNGGELLMFNLNSKFLILLDNDLDVSIYKITKTKQTFKNNNNIIIIEDEHNNYNLLIDKNKENWICNKKLNCIKIKHIYTIKSKFYNLYINYNKSYINITKNKQVIFELL